jgi:hypothetical protein
MKTVKLFDLPDKYADMLHMICNSQPCSKCPLLQECRANSFVLLNIAQAYEEKFDNHLSVTENDILEIIS